MLNIEMVRGDRRLWAKRELNDWLITTKVGAYVTDEQMAVLASDFFREGCDRFTIYLEDVILVCPPDPNGYSGPDHRIVVAFDTVTGIRHETVLSAEEMRAILMLSIGGDGPATLYATLETVLAYWPNECRPIP